MSNERFPVRGLRLTSADIELRFATADDIEELAAVTSSEPYDPSVPWLAYPDDGPVDRPRRLLQHIWSHWADLRPNNWCLDLVPVVDGRPAGIQSIRAKDFAVLAEASTGSWLAPAARGRGIGTAMRAAILHFGFEGLGAAYMLTGADPRNAASLRVTEKFGYAQDGLMRVKQANGEPQTVLEFRLDADTWKARDDRPDVEIHGLHACRRLLGTR